MTKKQNSKCQADEEYKPRNQTKSGSQKKKSPVVQNPLINSSKWTIEQNNRFLNFLKLNREILSCPLRRKEQKVFLQLSKAILTRTPDQCKSHHQKMVKHHNDFDGIITHLEKKISLPPIYRSQQRSQEIQGPHILCQFLQNLSNPNNVVEKQQLVEQNFFFGSQIAIVIQTQLRHDKIFEELMSEWI